MSKKWIIRDLDGNLPTSIEAEALRRALTQEEYTQRVWSATSPGDDPEGPLGRCEWGFEDGMEVSIVEGFNAEKKDLIGQVFRQEKKISALGYSVRDLQAELSRRPTLIDVIKSTYRMVRG